MRIEKIEKMIVDGVDLDIIKLGLKAYFENEDFINWKANKEKEYKSLETELEFNDWLNQTKSILVGTVDEEDANGVVYEKEIFENQPIHIYTPNDVTSLVDEYLANNKYLALQSLEITSLDNGLRFYTDDKSLIDLMIADREAERLGATNEDMTDWKTPDGIKQVSIKDIRDAIAKRLSNKAKIVGVV